MIEKKIELKLDRGTTSGILLTPPHARGPGVLLAHGAGGNMHAPFLKYFQEAIVEAGFSCMRFNFLYSEQRRKSPDPQPVLLDCFRKAMEAMPEKHLVLGGKSMGGRMGSYIADDPRVSGLFFLGYPLHPPAKTDQLRDAHLYSIRKPMFFASGTKDPFAQFDLLEQTIGRIGGFATTHIIEDGGHSFEVPKKSGRSTTEVLAGVRDALLTWMKQLS